jgi:hypothetical protein
LFDVFNTQYNALFKSQTKDECRQALRYILSCNILHGDALTLKTVGAKPQPIVFSEWSAVNGSLMKRRDYVFDDLVRFSTPPPPSDLFSPENIINTDRMNNGGTLQNSDLGDYSYQVHSIKDYPLIHFLDLGREQSND